MSLSKPLRKMYKKFGVQILEVTLAEIAIVTKHFSFDIRAGHTCHPLHISSYTIHSSCL